MSDTPNKEPVTVQKFITWNFDEATKLFLEIQEDKAKMVALQSRIAELEAKQRWIPVSEPPKESGEYFTLTQVEGENFVGTAVYEKKHNHWWNDMGDRDDITHWMTLPEPPEESDNDPA